MQDHYLNHLFYEVLELPNYVMQDLHIYQEVQTYLPAKYHVLLLTYHCVINFIINITVITVFCKMSDYQ